MIDTIRRKYQLLAPVLDERSRRVWAAAEAASLGYGGQSIVAIATGISRTTIHNELRKQHVNESESYDVSRCRSPGGGRKKLIELDTGLMSALEHLVEPTTRGDPESPLRWTCKSTRQLAEELKKQGYQIERQTVATLLDKLEYSLQGNQKTKEGSSSPDRDAQFKYINSRVLYFQGKHQPVISVDAKKKELVGNFKNNGKEWHPKGESEEVNVYDFMDKALGKVNPYGVYDQTANIGWVSVGIDHDTSDFAVETVRRWWERMGKQLYQGATDLLITADGGGSNGSRVRLWKVALQKFADQAGLRISVCHFPPGTSKWNKIEHRMFSHISMNWRGKPLISHDVIVNLISNTTTRKGLKIEAELDTNVYQIGVKVTDEEMEKLQIERSEFHGEWNYIITPKK